MKPFDRKLSVTSHDITIIFFSCFPRLSFDVRRISMSTNRFDAHDLSVKKNTSQSIFQNEKKNSVIATDFDLVLFLFFLFFILGLIYLINDWLHTMKLSWILNTHWNDPTHELISFICLWSPLEIQYWLFRLLIVQLQCDRTMNDFDEFSLKWQSFIDVIQLLGLEHSV